MKLLGMWSQIYRWKQGKEALMKKPNMKTVLQVLRCYIWTQWRTTWRSGCLWSCCYKKDCWLDCLLDFMQCEDKLCLTETILMQLFHWLILNKCQHETNLLKINAFLNAWNCEKLKWTIFNIFGYPPPNLWPLLKKPQKLR